MKIIIFQFGKDASGAPKRMQLLAQSLIDFNANCIFVTSKDSLILENFKYKESSSVEFIEGFSFISSPSKFNKLSLLLRVIYSNYKSFFIVKKQIITSDRLILVTRSFFSVVQYFLPKLVFGKKLHWVLDIDLESNGNGFFSRMSRKLSLSFCDAIVFQDSYQKSCFLKTVDSDRFEGKTFINTPGINIPAVINNSKYSQDKRKVRLISVANLSKRKNQLLIAEVASILKFKYNLGVEVLFFGKVLDYDYVNDITSALNSSNLNFSECFKGWSSSPFENLPDNSIFLLTSTGEGVSNSLQEAMLRGIIVFASKVGGAVDVVRDCETGFIVDSFDAEVWAEKIHSMFVCRDLSFISKISQSAASYSLESFTVESWVRKYLEIFEKV